jgi:ABC-2 type transport system ATP-binding protein
MIRAEGLTKYYDSRCVVDDVSFEIGDQQIVGFLGRNGAGKTTVLRMLAGLLSPSSGRIEIDGADLLDDPLGLRHRIGFLPERPPLYEDMTVAPYLEFAARLRGVEPERLDEVLRMTDLTSVRDQEVGTLSHGYRQRLGIAQAIVHDPALVVLDEPINGLDPVQIKEMRGLIRALRERHTVLVSSHILTEISQTCDRVLVLQGGRLAFKGTEAELRARMKAEAREVRVTVIGPRAEVERLLSESSVVERHEVHADADGELRAEVLLAEPAPEKLVSLLVGAGFGLRRLEPGASELESLFIELTGAEN